jgi:hypothetical protein
MRLRQQSFQKWGNMILKRASIRRQIRAFRPRAAASERPASLCPFLFRSLFLRAASGFRPHKPDFAGGRTRCPPEDCSRWLPCFTGLLCEGRKTEPNSRVFPSCARMRCLISKRCPSVISLDGPPFGGTQRSFTFSPTDPSQKFQTAFRTSGVSIIDSRKRGRLFHHHASKRRDVGLQINEDAHERR